MGWKHIRRHLLIATGLGAGIAATVYNAAEILPVVLLIATYILLISSLRQRHGNSLWHDAWRRLLRNRAAIIAGLILLGMITIAVLTPWIAPYDSSEQNLKAQFQPPDANHWFGTDSKGRDLLTRVMYGSRISLLIGFVATAVALIIGVTFGAIAGYIGGKIDNLLMRIVDVLYALPYMFLVILLVVLFGRNIINLFIALGVFSWLTIARITRGQVLSLKEKEFVEASRGLGASHTRILGLHIIPNLLGPVIVYSTLTVPAMILWESFLSFLGLGVQPPQASWGSLATEGAAAINPIEIYWWLILFPGIALILTLFSMNFLGDGLRDALDPGMKE